MARRQSDLPVRSDGPPLDRIGRFALRSGRFLVVLSLPLVLLAGSTVLLAAPSLASGVDAVLAATTGPLGRPDGLDWLFHVGILGVLVGAWLSGAGLVFSGLFD